MQPSHTKKKDAYHSQEEVRLRALDNIINKLNYGIVQTIDLACDRLLISKLLQWFLRPATSKKLECLQLLLKICAEEVGCKTVFSLGGLQFLQSLKTDIELECHSVIDSLLERLFVTCHSSESDAASERVIYQQEKAAGNEEVANSKRRTSSTYKAASEEVLSRREFSDRSSRAKPVLKESGHETESSPRHTQWYSQAFPPEDGNASGFQVVEFPWITLCPTDMHVLESTNQSLVSQDPQLMISACDFLVDVMLFDFPAEIFLQRPLIVKTLMKLLRSLPDDASAASDVSLSIVSTLIKLCDSLKARVNFHKDPATFAPKQDILALNPLSVIYPDNVTTSVDQENSSSTVSQYSRPSVVGVSDEMDEDKTQSTSLSSDEQKTRSSHRSVSVQMTTPNIDEIELQSLQLLLPDFCLTLHKCALSVAEKCNNRLRLELLRLLVKLQTLLKLSITKTLWSDISQYARDLCEVFRREINGVARVALKFHQLANSSSSNEIPEIRKGTNQLHAMGQMRQAYILLSQLSIDLYGLVPTAVCSNFLGGNERQLLYTICCDESLSQSIPNMRERSVEILKLVDTGSHDVYQAARVMCDSMTMFCDFLLASPYTGKDTRRILKLVSQADKAIYSISHHMNTDIISVYVMLSSHSYGLLEMCDEGVTEYMMNTLLKYMAHPLSTIRKESYKAIVAVLKSSLSFDAPTQSSAEGIRFLTNHSLLWEVACFGLSSEIPELVGSSQDIFNYLIQSRMLISDDLWRIICKALLPILPVIQSYASTDTTLGKCLLALTDTHFDSNISAVHCVKGAMRILFTSNKDARVQATKVLMTELNSLYSSYLLYPLTETKRYESHIIHMDTLVREQGAESSQRAVLNEESVTRVLRVFLADGVETGVRLTSLNQLSVILQNPHTHRYYLERDGLKLTLETIEDSILPDRSTEDEEATPPAVTILASLLQYNSDLRLALAADVKCLLTLLRCCWLFPSSTRVSIEAAQCLTYIIFDEISPKSTSRILSLPKTCCVRYQFPLRVMSYCDISNHRVDAPPTIDPIAQTLPLQMLRIFWNITWHNKVEYLLDSLDKQQTQSGLDRLALTPADIRSLKDSNTLYAVFRSLQNITNATTHQTVNEELSTLTAYSLICALDTDHRTISTITWASYFHRFLNVEPVAPMDKDLLTRILEYFTTVVNLGMTAATTNLLTQLYTGLNSDKDSVLLSLLQDSAYREPSDAPLKRSIQNSLLSLLSAVGISRNISSTERPRRSALIRAVLKRLTMADASNFYNLASLESSVFTLLRLTSRKGWSYGCADMDSRSLCALLIKALFEVLSAFHLGRQGNSLSYMGKGVLRNATLCLRHVVEEIARVVVDNESWLTPWIEGAEGETRLEWLRSLWNYRDQEVRAAALGVSVALVHSSLDLDSMFTSVTEMIHDAANIVVDSTECSLVRRQAAILISNLITGVYRQQLKHGDISGKKQLLGVYDVLDSVNYFTEIFTILSSDIFIESDLNIDSLHRQIRPELGDSICNVVYPTVATAAFLSSIMQGLLLLTKVLPSNTLIGLQESNVTQHLIGFYSSASVRDRVVADADTADQSGLRCAVIGLCADIISLLRSCVIQSKYLRNRTLSIENADHVTNILSIFHVQFSDDDETAAAMIRVWKELFLYLTAQIHIDLDSDVCMDRIIVPNLISSWTQFTAMSVHMLRKESEPCRVCVLEFWSIVLGLSYNRENSTRVRELLDSADDGEAFGSVLYSCMLPLYDAMLLRYSDKECIQERLSVINCMKSLLAVSQTAKSSALNDGLVESLLSHMNSFIGKLHLLATHKLGALSEGNAYLAELVVSLEMCTNFMLDSNDVKQAMSEVGLANLIHRLWFYCESDVQLMMTCISILTTYTVQCPTACRYMVCTSVVSCLGMTTDKQQIQSNSLADILVRLMHNQLNRMHVNLEILTNLFQLMCNFALSPDTLSAICKNSFANGFALCERQQPLKGKVKIQTALIKHWVQFYLNLSYTLDGQKLILGVKDSVVLLVDQLTSSDDSLKEMVLIILYNLSVGFRSKVLTNDSVPLTAVRVLEDSNCTLTTKTYAVEILKALIYDSMKGKALVKGLCIPERLEEVINNQKQEQIKCRIQIPESQSLAHSLQQILVTIRE